MIEAIRSALDVMMDKDPNVVLARTSATSVVYSDAPMACKASTANIV